MSNPWLCAECRWPVPGDTARCPDFGAVRASGAGLWDADSPPLQGWRVFLFRVVPYAAIGFVVSGMGFLFVGGVIVQLLGGDDASPGVVATVLVVAVFSPLVGAAVGIGKALMESSSEQAACRDRID